MSFCFYPNHEYGCPNVMHCPHLGGAALGDLVLAAGEGLELRETYFRQLDLEREQVSRLVGENERLQAQIEQLKLELKVERQSKFATSAGSRSESSTEREAETERPKKRGAPKGHPGWSRPVPTEYDRLIDVDAAGRCPHCGGVVHLFPNVDPDDHLQEDVVDGVYQVVLYRHPAARCDDCRSWVKTAGEGEILGSRIGPRLRASGRVSSQPDRHQLSQGAEGPGRTDRRPLHGRCLARFREEAGKAMQTAGRRHRQKDLRHQRRGPRRRNLLDARRKSGLLLGSLHGTVRPLPIRHLSRRAGLSQYPGAVFRRHAGDRLLLGLPRPNGRSQAEMPGPFVAYGP
jgi:hypothetical protein